jgi:hypothetical protein
VGLGHEQIVVADARRAAAASRSAVNRNKFSNMISLADLDRRRFAGVFEVLWGVSDGHEWKGVRLVAYRSIAVDNNVRVEPDPVAERDRVAYYAKWPYDAIGTDRGIFTYYCRRVDLGCHRR